MDDQREPETLKDVEQRLKKASQDLEAGKISPSEGVKMGAQLIADALSAKPSPPKKSKRKKGKV